LQPSEERKELASVSIGEKAMKTILSALVALSVIAGVAGSASALDAKTFYEQVDRDHY
jgi:hypothetical protein